MNGYFVDLKLGRFLGDQWIATYNKCIYTVTNSKKLIIDDARTLKAITNNLTKELGIEVMDVHFHEFTEHGVTLSYILGASHLILSSWPEKKFGGTLKVDYSSCSEKPRGKDLLLGIGKMIGAETLDYKVLENFERCDIFRKRGGFKFR